MPHSGAGGPRCAAFFCALIGAIVVGISRAAAVHLYPELELFVIYAIMALVLIFRPEGLFAPIKARKI